MLVPRSLLTSDALDVAPRLLGCVLRVTDSSGGVVGVRITEVEAYHGKGTGEVPDLASHARMGLTARNATMWGEPGHLYVYMNYGIHHAVNVACSPQGRASGVLLRGGEVVEGLDLARHRRVAARRDIDLARGPGRLAQALGLVSKLHDGIDALGGQRGGVMTELVDRQDDASLSRVQSGPRTGVAGDEVSCGLPWRFWIDGEPTVSPFRPGRRSAHRQVSVED